MRSRITTPALGIIAAVSLASCVSGGPRHTAPAKEAAPQPHGGEMHHGEMHHGKLRHGEMRNGEMHHGEAKAATKEETAAPVAFESTPQAGTKARCPVTGETFIVDDKRARSTHDGQHYVFCCAGCKPRFDADPSKFASR